MTPLILKEALTNIGALAETLSWQPFRPGVEISRLYGDGREGASAAFLRYAPGASVPYHTHGGYEHIFVLAGSQVDRTGRNEAGTVIINPPGSEHHVVSPDGCIVLVIWEKPVVVMEGAQRPAASSERK